jgi:hypothetical protein
MVNVLLIGIGGEALARWLLPAGLFSAAGDIYMVSAAPGVGYTMRPGFRGFAFGAPLAINAFGFRGAEWSPRKPPGKKRLALVGDSHAFGYGLRYEDALGAQLQRRLGAEWEVLVFAAPGWNAAQERAVVREYVWRFEPDVLVLLATNNDAEPPFFADEAGYLHAVHDPRELTAANRVVDEYRRRVAPPSWLARHSRLYLALQMALERRKQARASASAPPVGRLLDTPDLPPPRSLVATLEQPIVESIADARARGVPFALLTIATTHDYRGVFLELKAREHVPLLELLGALRDAHNAAELNARYALGWDPHYNADANRQWADATIAFLREAAVVP